MSNTVKKPLIIAHRGSSASAPENTFAAFSRALADKTEGIEFDVRITRDGVPVVFHDASLKRIAGDDTRISSMNIEELNNVDAGSWFNDVNPERADLRFIGERIPTFEAVLEFLKHFSGSIYIELKGTQRNMKRLAAAVGEVLKKYVGDQRFIVKSFQLEIIPMILKCCPGCKYRCPVCAQYSADAAERKAAGKDRQGSQCQPAFNPLFSGNKETHAGGGDCRYAGDNLDCRQSFMDKTKLAFGN